jgi:hypothetical protein
VRGRKGRVAEGDGGIDALGCGVGDRYIRVMRHGVMSALVMIDRQRQRDRVRSINDIEILFVVLL